MLATLEDVSQMSCIAPKDRHVSHHVWWRRKYTCVLQAVLHYNIHGHLCCDGLLCIIMDGAPAIVAMGLRLD